MQLLREYTVYLLKSWTVPFPLAPELPAGQSTRQYSTQRDPVDELMVVWFAFGQGFWAIPVVPDVTGPVEVEEVKEVVDWEVGSVVGVGVPVIELSN